MMARPEILNRNGWRLWLANVLSVCLLAVGPSRLLASQSVELSWIPSTNADVDGYNVYYGTASGDYSFMLNLGNENSTVINHLNEGSTYYFVVSTVDSLGDESPLSQEVSYTIPLPVPPTLQTQTLLDGNGQANAICRTGFLTRSAMDPTWRSWSCWRTKQPRRCTFV
jgi:hypothetical protein